SVVRSMVSMGEYSGCRGPSERVVRSSLPPSENMHRTGNTLAYSITSFARDLGVMRGRGMPRPHLYDVTSIADLPQQREDHLSLIDIFGYVRDYRLVPWSSPSGALDL